MLNSFEYRGKWFLPKDIDRKINGRLRYDSSEGGFLELDGSFSDTFDQEIILGTTKDGLEFTLNKTFVTHAQYSSQSGDSSDYSLVIYSVNFIFEGIQISSLDDLKFNEISSEIYNLEEWIGISGYQPTEYPDSNGNGMEFNVKYSLPNSIDFAFNENLNAKFKFKISYPVIGPFRKEVLLRQWVYFILISKEKESIDSLLNQLFHFQNFLILCLLRRTYPTSIKLYREDFVDELGKIEVNLYFPIANQYKNEKPKSDRQMLLGYNHIKENFDVIIQKWFQQHEKLEEAINLLIEQFHYDRYTSNVFLNLAQSAETIHSRLHSGPKIPKEEYKAMQDHIYENVDEIYHIWLEDVFKYGNNMNLHDRLNELVNNYSNTFLDKIIDEKEAFVRKIKWSRNYYTHYSSDLEKKAAKGIELFEITEKLKILLVCVFLETIGIEKTLLESRLESIKHWSFPHFMKF